MPTTSLKSFDTFVIFATTSRSFPLSLTEIGLILRPISTGIACVLTISIQVIFEKVVRKHNRYKNQFERYQETIDCFDILYRRSSQDFLIDKSEYESPCNIFTKYFNETKKNFFCVNRVNSSPREHKST